MASIEQAALESMAGTIDEIEAEQAAEEAGVAQQRAPTWNVSTSTPAINLAANTKTYKRKQGGRDSNDVNDGGGLHDDHDQLDKEKAQQKKRRDARDESDDGSSTSSLERDKDVDAGGDNAQGTSTTDRTRCESHVVPVAMADEQT